MLPPIGRVYHGARPVFDARGRAQYGSVMVKQRLAQSSGLVRQISVSSCRATAPQEATGMFAAV